MSSLYETSMRLDVLALHSSLSMIAAVLFLSECALLFSSEFFPFGPQNNYWSIGGGFPVISLLFATSLFS